MNCMRILIFIFTVLISGMIPNHSTAQQPDSTSRIALLPYFGFGIGDPNIKIGHPFQRGDAKLVGLPVGLGFKTIFNAGTRVDFVVDFNFVHTGVSYYNPREPAVAGLPAEEFHRRTSTKFRILSGIHLNFIQKPGFRTYFAILLGAKYVNRKYTVDGVEADLFYVFPLIMINETNTFLRPNMRAALGLEYLINARYYVNVELGLGSNPAQLGFGMRF